MAGNVPIYTDQGGALMHVASGGQVKVESGGQIRVEGDVNFVGTAAAVTFTPAAGGSNVCEVTIQLVDADGTAAPFVFPMLVYLSDAATGEGLTATTASGEVAAKSGHTDLSALVSKKAILVLTKADGSYVLSITDSAKTAFRVCAVPATGSYFGGVSISSALVTGNYG